MLYFSLKKVKKNDWTILFGLKKTWDVNIYIHSPGDEIWLIFISFPVEVAHIRLDSNNSDGVWSSDLSITENEIVHLDTETAHCKFYAEKVNIFCGCPVFYLRNTGLETGLFPHPPLIKMLLKFRILQGKNIERK